MHAAEAIVAPELSLIMETLGDKERKVQVAAENAVTAFRDMMADSASLLSLLPTLIKSFTALKFKTQICSLNFVAHIARTLPKLVGNHMILLVPPNAAVLHDLKDETAAAALDTMKVQPRPMLLLLLLLLPPPPQLTRAPGLHRHRPQQGS